MSQIAFPCSDPAILARADAIRAALRGLLPPECVVVDEAGRRAFETDALTAYRRLPLAVVLPRTTQEVAATLRFCREHGVAVVPRGAGTSLAGGAVPQEDAIVIGLSKMNRVLEVNYRRPLRARRGRRHQSGDLRGRGGGRVLLRARPFLAARLHHRRQCRR